MDKPFNGHDDSLIALLLEETYKTMSENSGEFEYHQLERHFDKQNSQQVTKFEPTLDNFLSRQSLASYQFSYSPHIGCYRLILDDTILDFPGNWSLFAGFRKELKYSRPDDETLASILSTSLMGNNNFIIIGNFGNLSLYVFEKNDEFSVQWLEKYFSKQDKKEAA